MLVSAAVCPHPPLLVPEVAGRATPDLDGLRAACDAALARVARAGADRLVVIGSGAFDQQFGEGTPGTLRPYGVDVPVALGEGPGGVEPGHPAGALPLSLT
ncbi:MAG: hypothetical protein ACRDPT_14535, partial [Streptomycetales bacterium]